MGIDDNEWCVHVSGGYVSIAHRTKKLAEWETEGVIGWHADFEDARKHALEANDHIRKRFDANYERILKEREESYKPARKPPLKFVK